MYNQSAISYTNALSKAKKKLNTKASDNKSKGLLARSGTAMGTQKEADPMDRVANYMSRIYDARMALRKEKGKS